MIVAPLTGSFNSRPALWRLIRDCLIEITPAGELVYGPWGGRFACWRRQDCAPAVPPARRWLDRRGMPLSPPGDRNDAWYRSRASLVAYFAVIPLALRMAVAPFGERQWQPLEWLKMQYDEKRGRAMAQ